MLLNGNIIDNIDLPKDIQKIDENIRDIVANKEIEYVRPMVQPVKNITQDPEIR